MSGEKKQTSRSQSKPAPPQALLDDIARHKYMAEQLERRGQTETFAHTRLEQLAIELEKYEVKDDGN